MSSDRGSFMYNSSLSQQLSEELLELVLQEEDLIYPWNATETEAEAYWADIDETVSLFDDWEEEALSDQADQFYSQLHQRWQTLDRQSVEEVLLDQYSPFLPAQWLEVLLDRAKSLVARPMESVDRLVVCVKPLLENWSDEDLQVFARPFAYSMRGTSNVKAIAWEDRSEIEKIKLAIAIAQEILIRLEKNQEPKA